MSGYVVRQSIDSIRRPNSLVFSSAVARPAFSPSGQAPFYTDNSSPAFSEPLRLPFLEHLIELRNRFFYFLSSVIIGSIVAYMYHEELVTAVTRPLNQSLFYSSPGGGFDFLIKLSLLSGLLLAVPVFIYQSLRFLEPLLSRRSHIFIITTVVCSYSLLIIGASFAYFIALPLAISFLSDFASTQVQSLIFTTEYLSFLMAYLLGFGLAFQLPLVLWIINAIHPFQKGQLWRQQKWVILFSFIAAAIVTPTPDIFNLLIMALPIVFLYQFAVVLIWWKNGARRSA